MTILKRVLLSIFPGSGKPINEQKGSRKYFRSLLLHFRPQTVSERTLRFSLTWGLGGMAAVLIFLLFCTGLMLKFVYVPLPDRAYESILHLQNNIPFGQLVRNIHHWSANILLVIVFLHFLRVFFTGAFTAPRQFNWIIGLALFGGVILSNFTGYLLPWDQLSYWAITISSSMLEYIPLVGPKFEELILGGKELGPATIANFYAIHTAVLPAVLLLVLPFHFWRIRKANGLVIPRSPDEDPDRLREKIEAIPNLIVREMTVALVLLAAVLLISMLFNAPLGDKANPGLSPNPTKAPWYFMGFQEMLMHFHPLYSLVIIPLLTVLFLLAIPYITYGKEISGVWFISKKGRKLALASAVASALLTALGILLLEYVIDFASLLPSLPAAVSNGLIPFILDLLVLAGLYIFIRKEYSASNQEMVQAVFVFLVTSFVILTITGVWFRGVGMKLMF
ncbi:MAG: cytochrome b N-terminal domain-containing protein [Deltaproteobacteria bacterium]|jgi:quinol-cytochrome oxidoreductase complex cytochrome b subunit|nr:cytochrome b N-terminal domain-containing protein [Deltaproteobacteria bacterium]